MDCENYKYAYILATKCADYQDEYVKFSNNESNTSLSRLRKMVQLFSDTVDASDEYLINTASKKSTETNQRVEILRRQSLILKELVNARIKLEYDGYEDLSGIISGIIDKDASDSFKSFFSMYKDSKYINEELSERIKDEVVKFDNMFKQIIMNDIIPCEETMNRK